jgi:hypothetical protein
MNLSAKVRAFMLVRMSAEVPVADVLAAFPDVEPKKVRNALSAMVRNGQAELTARGLYRCRRLVVRSANG